MAAATKATHYCLPAGAQAYVHTGLRYLDRTGAHSSYLGYIRHILLNTSIAKNPDLRLKKSGSRNNTARDGTTYSC
ncbi:hypothetical protein [Streptomyces sp. NPDC002057]|uniref:hypothetical protein n=1 Tax=Streptomyces sp. NPDC002057 TaxID=3154664 RepID=UPI00332A1839